MTPMVATLEPLDTHALPVKLGTLLSLTVHALRSCPQGIAVLIRRNNYSLEPKPVFVPALADHNTLLQYSRHISFQCSSLAS
jgi:hypothetical protein